VLFLKFLIGIPFFLTIINSSSSSYPYPYYYYYY